jgi:hypothetical protein
MALALSDSAVAILRTGSWESTKMSRRCFAFLFIVLMVAKPSFAEDRSTVAGDVSTFSAAELPALPAADVPQPSRGPVLPLLYVSFAALNAYDGSSTLTALKLGAVEGNPVMAGVAARPAALWAVKAGVTTASVVVAERLWRQHHRTAAIVMMVVSNGMMAAVAARNASVIRRLK